MLLGEYTHTVDSKRRVSLPAKFRQELGKKVVVTHGLDRCIFVYSEKSWRSVTEKLSELSLGQGESRGFNRFLLSGAHEVEIDSAGRILIPDFLSSYANLGQKVVVAGVMNRAEIWDEDAWTRYKRSVEEKADELAQKLGDLGLL